MQKNRAAIHETFSHANGNMNTGGFYFTPQPLQHNLPCLVKRQRKPIRIQDPNDGNRDITLDELWGGRPASSVTALPSTDKGVQDESMMSEPEPRFVCESNPQFVWKPDPQPVWVPEPLFVWKPEPQVMFKPELRFIWEPEPRPLCEPEPQVMCEPEPQFVWEPKPQPMCEPEPQPMWKPEPPKRATWAEIVMGNKQTETTQEQKKQDKQQLSANTQKSSLSKNTKKVELYVWNLDYSVDNKRLYNEFHSFGTIIHAKVMMEDGRSRGFGYVIFSSQAEALTAIKEMNGKMLGRRALNVSLSKFRENDKPYSTQGKQNTESSRPTKPWQSPRVRA
ncbi:RNA-binding protein 42-like isoform X2 [Silurus meridionalis]|uniref:RNA-binding protein 42-like isoform X2 n=1 Tax=Silurus meridionalis TaxID=175797 RepID=UPI001EECF29B|nr:RNA-binding protein 42-like isoform X2 [Silurus meridionalis]